MKTILAAIVSATLAVLGFNAVAGAADPGTPHAQLNASVSQTDPGRVALDTVDSSSGVVFDDDNDTMTVEEGGLWLVVAAPQVGAITSDGKPGGADFWLSLNGEQIPNSNVRWQDTGRGGDVIVVQTTLLLEPGDTVAVEWSTDGAALEAIQPEGEPVIPAIIFTMAYLG